MKKILLSLGSLAAIVVPVASVIACGSNSGGADGKGGTTGGQDGTTGEGEKYDDSLSQESINEINGYFDLGIKTATYEDEPTDDGGHKFTINFKSTKKATVGGYKFDEPGKDYSFVVIFPNDKNGDIVVKADGFVKVDIKTDDGQKIIDMATFAYNDVTKLHIGYLKGKAFSKESISLLNNNFNLDIDDATFKVSKDFKITDQNSYMSLGFKVFKDSTIAGIKLVTGEIINISLTTNSGQQILKINSKIIDMKDSTNGPDVEKLTKLLIASYTLDANKTISDANESLLAKKLGLKIKDVVYLDAMTNLSWDGPRDGMFNFVFTADEDKTIGTANLEKDEKYLINYNVHDSKVTLDGDPLTGAPASIVKELALNIFWKDDFKELFDIPKTRALYINLLKNSKLFDDDQNKESETVLKFKGVNDPIDFGNLIKKLRQDLGTKLDPK